MKCSCLAHYAHAAGATCDREPVGVLVHLPELGAATLAAELMCRECGEMAVEPDNMASTSVYRFVPIINQ